MESRLNESPPRPNVLVVDPNPTTLLDMMNIMRKYNYQVMIETNAERALKFLITCKHEINIVIWDFHMPEINGIKALEAIGSMMDLPVLIMSDDDPVELVWEATIHGACHYVKKPVREDVLSILWQHIVRRRMKSKAVSIPVQSDRVHFGCLDQVNADSKIVDQEHNTYKGDEKSAKITRTRDIRSYLVQTEGLDQDKYDFKFLFKDKVEENMEKKIKKKPLKRRLNWTEDLHQKFLQAIEIVGGIKKATPKLILNCLQNDMKIEGLIVSNVSSHLQKYRMTLEKTQIANQQTPGIGWSLSRQGSNNVQIASSSCLLNDQAMNPIQQNQYQNGYLTMDNNHFMITNPQPRFPYFNNLHEQSHQSSSSQQQQHQSSTQQEQYQSANQQQQYQSSSQQQQHQSSNEQASDISATDGELIYSTNLPYDPNEFFPNGYNPNQ